METSILSADIAIIGGGPIGLLLAIELGQRDIATVVLERRAGLQTQPAANHHTARTMEHYRRLGLATAMRNAGLPPDFAPDVTFWTALGDRELARLPIPSSRRMMQSGWIGAEVWPTPEPPHRCSQLYFEQVLVNAARQQANIRLLNGWRAVSIDQQDSGITLTAAGADPTHTLRLDARYLVGCDGPRSLVRDHLGIRLSGTRSVRSFMGGQMMALHFSSPFFYARSARPPAWHYWFIDDAVRALVVSVDGDSNFQMNVAVPEGTGPDQIDPRALITRALGIDLPFSLHGVSPWVGGHALVADCMARGRMMLAGDAAHLFTPTGGIGYNTGVGDAANLAWKLEAVCKGWAPDTLLASYDTERRQSAQRNTGFSRWVGDEVETLSLAGATPERLLRHMQAEFLVPGCHLGERYTQSSIIIPSGDIPPDDFAHHADIAFPGGRAPHLWLPDGTALFDAFGRHFALLHHRGADPTPLAAAARRRGLPLQVIAPHATDLAARYPARLTLIRPDQHIAWQSDAPPPDPDALFARVLGFGARAGAATVA